MSINDKVTQALKQARQDNSSWGIDGGKNPPNTPKGEKVVEQFSEWIKEKDPPVKNFDRRNIYRMREFFLSYHNVSWSMRANELLNVGSTKPQIEDADNENNTDES